MVVIVRRTTIVALLLVVSCDTTPADEQIAPVAETAGPSATQLKPSSAVPAPPNSTSRSFGRPNWVDADHDCQSPRAEVLVLEATGPVEFDDDRHCKVTRGTWRCPYTGKELHDPHELDIDHLVPLKNAWDSGASGWTDERWRQYANELEHDEHLVAVAASANRAKADRRPTSGCPRWPRLAALRPGLGDDQGEVGTQGGQLASPGALRYGERSRRCHDSCIARDKGCSVEPGCACDG